MGLWATLFCLKQAVEIDYWTMLWFWVEYEFWGISNALEICLSV